MSLKPIMTAIPVDNCKVVFVFNVNIGTLWLSDRQAAKFLKLLLNDRQQEMSLKS